MEYTIKLNEQQVELLKLILAQIEPKLLITTPSSGTTKKMSKNDKIRQSIMEARTKKALRKRKN